MVSGPRWLDTVLAVPAIGISTHSWLAFASGVWEAIERTHSKWQTDGLGQVNIEVANAVDIRVNRDAGLYLALTPSTVVAGYTFNMAAVSKPGQLPQLRSNTSEKSYTDLQNQALSMLLEFIKTGFGGSKERDVIRVGVVAEARMVESEAPPGIGRFIADVETAVRNKLTVLEGTMLAEVGRRPDGHDQCHHVTKRNAIDEPDDLTFRMDYQRVWTPPTRMNATGVLEAVRATADAANYYFERFGSGEV